MTAESALGVLLGSVLERQKVGLDFSPDCRDDLMENGVLFRITEIWQILC